VTTLNVAKGVKLAVIEATADTVQASAGRSSPAVLMWLKVDGANDVAFEFEDTDGTLQTITVKTTETVTDPISFKNVKYTAAAGASAFRIRAHQEVR
jgi:hypothetical protein